jgi:hypothetical protein
MMMLGSKVKRQADPDSGDEEGHGHEGLECGWDVGLQRSIGAEELQSPLELR